ncbi:hypothetical protein PL373_05635 [Tenacibaculum maritimum]|nr:hypothetical protein [Tenacibaculum maritimum]MDB0600632.1 hypothetical protein [Tenacibaculum maritimum]MDB0612302.1 hypothetical protein [Tenacibaculum maritimum]
MNKQEWVHIPDYLNHKAIFNTKRGVLFQIIEFHNNKDSANWVLENEESLKSLNIPYLSIHKKYPFVVFPISFYKELTLKKVEALTNKACDIFATKWLSKQSLKQSFNKKATSLWRIADNQIDFPNRIDFIKVSSPICIVTVKDDYTLKSFEEFREMAVLNILEPNSNYTDIERENIIIEAYNFSVLEEKTSFI